MGNCVGAHSKDGARTVEVEEENVWEENTPKWTSTLAPSSIVTKL